MYLVIDRLNERLVESLEDAKKFAKQLSKQTEIVEVYDKEDCLYTFINGQEI